MARGNLTILQGGGDERSTSAARTRRRSTAARRSRWDHLIVAAGATHSYFGHDDWQRHAPGLKTLADAFDIRARVIGAFESAERCDAIDAERDAWLTFVVIGGGPTGVEMAGTMSEIAQHTLPREFRRIDPKQARVVLLEGVAAHPRRVRARSCRSVRAEQLERLGVDVRTESQGDRHRRRRRHLRARATARTAAQRHRRAHRDLGRRRRRLAARRRAGARQRRRRSTAPAASSSRPT